jgi:dihydroorotase-like cyclic amidohydrolase
MAALRLPGLIDVHVHLREPGGEQKEDMTSGTAAALAGGVTLVLDMPNTVPPTINAEALARKKQVVRQKALCDVGLYLGASETNALQAAAQAGETVGLKIYLDQTYGPLQVQNLAALLTHFRTWPADRPIAVHAEGLSLAIAVGLARSFGRRLHVCHVSRADEIGLIRAAKESGAALTCEATPHHLFLDETDISHLGPYGSMRPPLASAKDQAALWASLDVVDCIATDHAPHTRAEKEGEMPPPGVPGLETMLPLLLTAVSDGRLSMERLIDLTHEAPRRIFGLEPQSNTWVDIDPDVRYAIDGKKLQTKCGWTPFEGISVQGRIRQVVVRGQTAFQDDRIWVQPGFGQPVEPPGRGP